MIAEGVRVISRERGHKVPNTGPTSTSHLLNVLLVEDSDEDARALETSSTDETIILHRVRDIQAARPLFRVLKFDGVLLDFSLPGVAGFDGLKELRALTSAPIVMWSGAQDKDDRIALAALQEGADHWLEKGASWSTIRRTIKIERFKRRAARLLAAAE